VVIKLFNGGGVDNSVGSDGGTNQQQQLSQLPQQQLQSNMLLGGSVGNVVAGGKEKHAPTTQDVGLELLNKSGFGQMVVNKLP
jgi:hypothetical protein